MRVRPVLPTASFLFAAGLGSVLASCSGAAGTFAPPARAAQSATQKAARATRTSWPDAFPAGYTCLPAIPAPATQTPQIAYADACSVSASSNAADLQRMAVAVVGHTGSAFNRYCTGTPVRYDATTGVGWVVSSAHCVVGGEKAAGAKLETRNITTFRNGGRNAFIYQGTPAAAVAASAITALITAIYIPSRYCEVPAFHNGGCSDLPLQNGDIAVLKVHPINGNTLGTLPDVRIAPEGMTLASDQPLLAFGYGLNTSSDPRSSILYYTNYRYYGTNEYRGAAGEAVIFNGYRANDRWYSIICQGDSGGADFAWDGQHWDLVGAHSYGPVPCGVNHVDYNQADDVSADIRPFSRWIERIFTDDTSPIGCAKLDADYTCAAYRFAL